MRAKEEKIIKILLVLLPSLVAVFVLTAFIRSFDYAKNLLFIFLLLLTIVLGLFQLWKNKSLSIPIDRFKSRESNLFIGMLFIIFLATLFSPQRLHSIWGSFERGMGLISWISLGAYFYLLLLFLDKKWMQRGLNLLFSTGTFIALYGILQHFGWDPLFGGFNVDYLEGRIFSTLGNPDFLAQLLAPLIVLGIYKIVTTKKYIYLPGIVFMTWALIYTESRASFLAVFFSLGIFIFLTIKKKTLLVSICATFLLLLLALSQTGFPLFDRLAWNEENLRSIFSRLEIWKISLQMIADHPFLGIGPDNYSIYFPEYMTGDFYALEEDLHISADRSHNELLDMGTIGGIPLLFIYLSLWLTIFISGFKKKTAQIYTFPLLTIFLQNQFTFSLLTHYILFLFLLAGLIIEKYREHRLSYSFSPNFKWLGLPLMFIFVLFLFKEMIVDRVYAETWYVYALSSDDTKAGLKNAIALDPLNTEFRYNLLMWFPEERNGQLEALRKIEGHSIEVLAWTGNELAGDNPKKAYGIFEEAIALNPFYFHTRRAYADALYLNGEYKQAALQYEAALENAPEFWKWCPNLSTHSEYEQKKYRIFYKNVPDFNTTLAHLYDSYSKLNDVSKLETLEYYLKCLMEENKEEDKAF